MGLRQSSAALQVLIAAAVVVGAQSPLQLPLGLDIFMPVPASNPLTRGKVGLGRKLFLDPILSADRSISCASCHDPALSFTDDRPTAVGVFGRVGSRRVPKLLNRGYGRSFFWDGRIPTLEEQVLQPVINSLEMDLPLAEAIERLRADPDYVAGFQNVFSGLPDETNLSQALASYVRTIVSGGSRYDRYVSGDATALDAVEQLGLAVFRNKGNCVTCHLGPNLTDERFHNTGIAFRGERLDDEGRFKVTGRTADRGAFKTPTLRNVAKTAPYMHDGSLATLGDVIDDYDQGGTANPYLDREMGRLGLTETEKVALEAFLKTLTGTVREGLRQ